MATRYKNRFDKQRRDFLKVVSSAGISRGLLGSCGLVGGMMTSRVAEAQAASPNKVLTVIITGGMLDGWWLPGGAPGALSLPVASQAYAPVASKMNFIQNHDTVNGNHGSMPQYLGHHYNQDSFDVLVGRVLGANTPVPYLNLGVQTEEGKYTAERPPMPHASVKFAPAINAPAAALSRLMASAGLAPSAPAPSAGGGPAVEPGAGGSRNSYLDFHRASIEALKTKLGAHELSKLDSHLTALRALEQRVMATPMPSGGIDNTPVAVGPRCGSGDIALPGGLSGADAFEQDAFEQIEIATLALSCNLTSSVSLCFGNDANKFIVPVYPGALHDTHHNSPNKSLTVSHAGAMVPAPEEFRTVAVYMHSLFARLLKRLDEEGVLDSTLVVQIADMGDAQDHLANNTPATISGGGGAIQTNRVTNGNRATNYDLFETAEHILGINESPDYQKYGEVVTGIST